MGDVIILDAKDVLPSKDFLTENSLYTIAMNIKDNTFHNLPPRPIVRRFNNRFIAIDGHNLLAVYAYLGMQTTVHVADTHDDFTGEPDAERRNKELQERFDISIPELRRVRNKGINSMADLVKNYDGLLKNIFNH